MGGFRINNNIPAIFAQRQLSITNRKLESNLQRLSSGLRINKAGDDAAGLAISEKLRTQVNGLQQAKNNIQDGISLIQTAEGGITTISDQLQRLRTLAVQASNDTLTTTDRSLLQLEVNQILAEIDRETTTIVFNTLKLLTGQFSNEAATGTVTYSGGRTSMVLQVGANEAETVAFFMPTISTAALGLRGEGGGLDLLVNQTEVSALVASGGGMTTRTGAQSAITLLTRAINRMNGERAKLGAIQNRLERTLNFVQIRIENESASESRIRDLDFSEEIVNFTKNQILQQSGTAALAQANVMPQTVLQLLQ